MVVVEKCNDKINKLPKRKTILELAVAVAVAVGVLDNY